MIGYCERDISNSVYIIYRTTISKRKIFNTYDFWHNKYDHNMWNLGQIL